MEAYVATFIFHPIEKKPRGCRIGYPTSTRGNTTAANVLRALAIGGSNMSEKKKQKQNKPTVLDKVPLCLTTIFLQ